jgi:hypothetical protein
MAQVDTAGCTYSIQGSNRPKAAGGKGQKTAKSGQSTIIFTCNPVQLLWSIGKWLR